MKPERTACMVAYANYINDARIKNYVDALLKAGFLVDVFALGQPEPARSGLRVFYLMPKTVSHKALPYILSQLWFLIKVLLRVGFACVQQQYKIIHVHNMPDFLVFGALVPKILGAKVILDIHDTMPENFATKFDISLSHPLIRLMRFEERMSAAFADLVITTNRLHKQTLVEHGIPENKICIVMNVGNPKIFHPRPKVKPAIGLQLAYHGTVTERLGLDLILEAIWRARPSCPELKFLLLGDGEYMPEVRKLITNYALEDIVQMKGWVQVEKLMDYLADIDIGIIGNRRHTEIRQNWMLPIKMLQYAAMEIPTIAPRLRVINDYFDDDNAFFYTPDNVAEMAGCIVDVYRHPEKLTHAKKGLQAFNQRYNWPLMEKRYMDMVTSLIENNNLPIYND